MGSKGDKQVKVFLGENTRGGVGEERSSIKRSSQTGIRGIPAEWGYLPRSGDTSKAHWTKDLNIETERVIDFAKTLSNWSEEGDVGVEDSRLLLWLKARGEWRKTGRDGREGVGGRLEGGGERTLVRTSGDRSRTHELKSKAELEDETNGDRSRLLIAEINDIAKKGEKGGGRHGGYRSPISKTDTSNTVINGDVLITVSGNRVDMVGDS